MLGALRKPQSPISFLADSTALTLAGAAPNTVVKAVFKGVVETGHLNGARVTEFYRWSSGERVTVSWEEVYGGIATCS